MHRDDGFANLGDLALVRDLGWVLHHDHLAIGLEDLVDHTRRGRDQVLVEFALQPLLHDLHVQQAQEAAAKAEAQRLAYFGFVVQGRVVELELFQRIAQRVVLVGLRRVQPGENLRLDFLETGQRLGRRGRRAARAGLDQRHGVADLGGLEFLDAGDDEAHLPGLERVPRLAGRREDTQVVGVIGGAGGHQLDALALAQAPVHDPHQHDDAYIGIEPAVDDHGAQRAFEIAARRRDAGHHGFENLIDAHAGLGRTWNRVAGVDADHVLDFRLGIVRVGLRQIHFVEHRHHFHSEVQRGVAVGDGLRFHALAGIDHEQRTLACGQRARHLVRKVHVAGRVDQIEVVDLSVARFVAQCGGLGLDGYPTLFFEIHRVEHLLFHLPIREAAATLDQAVCERRFAMIDVRDDRKVSDVIHQRERLSD